MNNIYHVTCRVHSPATGRDFTESKDIQTSSIKEARKAAKQFLDVINQARACPSGTFSVIESSVRFYKKLDLPYLAGKQQLSTFVREAKKPARSSRLFSERLD